jgi:hypothetical protein
MFLTGTTVKEQAYGVSLFGEFFAAFHDYLNAHHTLICCGYGWADKGINIRLHQWLRNAEANRVVILHNDPEDILAHRRFWRFKWDRFEKAAKIIVIKKWLNECSLTDLEPWLDVGQSEG